jgi:HK97 family phage major capsid protein
LVEETVNLNYLAGFLKVSRKMLRNFSALQAYISRWLPEKYYNAEDAQVMTALATGTGQVGGGDDILAILVNTIGAQRQAKYNVNAIIVNGDTWASLLTVKIGSGEYVAPIGSVTISPAGQMMICGVPVYVASWVGSLKAIVCDTNYFTIVQSEGLSVMFSEFDTDNFQKNKVTVRVEASVGFALLDPAAISLVDFDA